MKSTTFALAAVSLLQLTAAQPFRRSPTQRSTLTNTNNYTGRHAHQHEKNDVVVTVVETAYAEATAGPHIVIYVDQDGKPVSTETVGAPVPTSTVAPVVASAPVATQAAQAVNVQEAAVSSATPAQTSSAAPAASSSASSSGMGFSYSPYNGDGTCKSQDQVNTDFAALPSGYSTVRVYGTDCNQVATVLSAAKSKSMKLFAGVYSLANLNSEIAIIVAAAGGDWSNFHTISIGNELVNSGSASPATVIAAMDTARGLLKTAGYTGLVVTVDTLVAALAHPELCDKSDYCAVNSHPFFDGNVVAADSGSFLTTQIANLKSKLSNQSQSIVITETGWPSQGSANSKAVPSSENQAASIASIKAAFSSSPSSVILFNTFNTMWKADTSSTFGAEKYWGFLGNCPSG